MTDPEHVLIPRKARPDLDRPLYAEPEPDGDGLWWVRAPDFEGVKVVAAIYCTEADATLFAAAPELLKCLGYFLTDERFQVAVGGNPNVVERMLAEARTVHAKATTGLRASGREG